jgi:hypothetical protein
MEDKSVLAAILGLARARRRDPLCIAAVASLFALVSCDLPKAPSWDVGVAIPFSSDTISIADFLPDVVDTAVVGGELAFTVDAQADSVEYSLGGMCPDCLILEGQTVLVPAFDYVDSLDVPFPAEVAALEVLSARLSMTVFNGLNFDPLRPGAGGYVAIAVTDIGTGALLDSIFIDGAAETLPAGTSRRVEVNLSNASISEGFRAKIYVHSPSDGQTVQIDNALRAQVAVALDQIYVAAVIAEVAGDTLTESFGVDIDDEVREQLADRVQSGEYELELMHSTEIAGVLEVCIAGSAGDLFTGDPTREVRLGQLDFVPGPVQTGSLTPAEIELIASFSAIYVGYRLEGWGTRTGLSGRMNLSRFTPGQTWHAEFSVISNIRVGD